TAQRQRAPVVPGTPRRGTPMPEIASPGGRANKMPPTMPTRIHKINVAGEVPPKILVNWVSTLATNRHKIQSMNTPHARGITEANAPGPDSGRPKFSPG